jgi:hypothetical protein
MTRVSQMSEAIGPWWKVRRTIPRLMATDGHRSDRAMGDIGSLPDRHGIIYASAPQVLVTPRGWRQEV